MAETRRPSHANAKRPVRHAHAQTQQPRAQAQPRRSGGAGVLRTILVALVTLVVGFGLGMFFGPKIKTPFTARVAPAFPGKATVAESELDAVLGSYTAGSTTVEVTVRDALIEEGGLEVARNVDGSYAVPAVDTVLAIARNDLLAQEANNRGIEATEDDALAYARTYLGAESVEEVASLYGMDVEQAHASLLRSASIGLLRDQIVQARPLEEPAAPAPAPEGGEDAFLAEYGAYVTDLLGDAWDKSANMWSTDTGVFREGLRDYTISNDGATYSAALAAYNIAYEQYAARNAEIAQEWTTYVNTMLSDVTVELKSLVA